MLGVILLVSPGILVLVHTLMARNFVVIENEYKFDNCYAEQPSIVLVLRLDAGAPETPLIRQVR